LFIAAIPRTKPTTHTIKAIEPKTRLRIHATRASDLKIRPSVDVTTKIPNIEKPVIPRIVEVIDLTLVLIGVVRINTPPQS
jgi:hypothetical protein